MDFKEFRARYEERHPASVPVLTPELSPYPAWLKYAVLLMFVCSALLSGVHTVPVVRAGIPTTIDSGIADIVSLTAFVSVELAILLSAYAMVGGGGLVVTLVLLLATGTALVANIYSVLKAYQDAQLTSGDDGTLIVAIIVGIVAPGIAFLSGKLFVNMQRAARTVDQRTKAAFTSARQAWDLKINAAWEAYEKTTANSSRTEETTQASANVSPNGRDQPSPAEKQVIAFLRTNPDALHWSRQQLANAAGVAKSTASNGARWVQMRPELMNGKNNHSVEDTDA